MRIRGSETVLTVDDDPVMRELVEKALTSKGYQVLSAASAEEALEVAGAHGRKIDLLLTDVMLPGMKGQDLAKQMLQKYPEVNILFMSGYLCPSMAHNDSERKYEGFIQKPFAPSSLLRKVRRILD